MILLVRVKNAKCKIQNAKLRSRGMFLVTFFVVAAEGKVNGGAVFNNIRFLLI